MSDLAKEKEINRKRDIIQEKDDRVSVTEFCKSMGISRDTFYRYKRNFDKGGGLALTPVSKKKPRYKMRLDPKIEKRVIEESMLFPSVGTQKLAQKLMEYGIRVSASGVRNILKRNGLENATKRKMALDTKVKQDGIVLQESQKNIKLKKTKTEEEPFLSHYPGFRLVQGYFYIGNGWDFGHLFIQIVIDTYSNMIFAKVSNEISEKNCIEILREKVVYFFKQKNIAIEAIITNRELNYSGNKTHHEYEKFLFDKGIRHIKLSKLKFEKLGILGNVVKKMENELFTPYFFQENTLLTLNKLQIKLDAWVMSYNLEYNFPDKWCFGKTPSQTFFDAQKIAWQNQLYSKIFAGH